MNTFSDMKHKKEGDRWIFRSLWSTERFRRGAADFAIRATQHDWNTSLPKVSLIQFKERGENEFRVEIKSEGYCVHDSSHWSLARNSTGGKFL